MANMRVLMVVAVLAAATAGGLDSLSEHVESMPMHQYKQDLGNCNIDGIHEPHKFQKKKYKDFYA